MPIRKIYRPLQAHMLDFHLVDSSKGDEILNKFIEVPNIRRVHSVNELR